VEEWGGAGSGVWFHKPKPPMDEDAEADQQPDQAACEHERSD
jgi:hypothetical protein